MNLKYYKATYKNKITKRIRSINIECYSIICASKEAEKQKKWYEEFIKIEEVR